MNVFKCSGQLETGKKCVYMKYAVNSETGELESYRCMMRNRDHYNIYPEFDISTGEVIYQNPKIIGSNGRPLPSSEADPAGNNLIWENITGHQNGLTFDFRTFDSYEHPNYRIVDHNVPSKHGMLDPDLIADVFGEEHIALVSSGWNDDKPYGKPNIEKCEIALYGSYDANSGIVIHRSMKNYSSNVLGWINYSTVPERHRQKRIFIMDASDDVIEAFCKEKFEDEATADRMIDILKAVRAGEYINLKEAALNNGMDEPAATAMMQEISTKSKATIYRGTVNIQRLYELYAALESMELDELYIKIYRINILNYILNYDVLQNVVLGADYYSTRQRYWFAYLIIKRAFNVDKIIDANNLPQWFVQQITEVKKQPPLVRVFNQAWTFNTAPDEVKEMLAEATRLGLKHPQELFPAICPIESILGDTYRQSSKSKRKVFGTILKAGVKWNITEIQSVWKKFTKCYDNKTPRIFWNYISELDDLDYDQLISRIDGDGNPGQKKTCFANLVSARVAHKKNNDWEIDVPNLVPSTMAGAKHKAKFRSGGKKNYFWKQLMKIGGLKQDKISGEEFLPADKIERLVEKTMLEDEIRETRYAPSDEQLVDADEYEQYSEFDPESGNTSPMVSRGDEECQAEE